MRADRFFDTNILIYAFANDPVRSPIAERLIAEGGQISVQVLNEFANVCRRKMFLDWNVIRQRLDVLVSLLGAPAPLTPALNRAAIDIAERHKLSFYDALIVAAAIEAGCTQIESEDMAHCQVIAGARINNPFKAANP